MSSFVHLHVHSEYSLLDGFSKIKKLTRRAKEMGMPAVALTDHGTMFGAIEFYNTVTNAGLKPIIGVEAYLAARGMGDRDAQLDKKSTHLLLLAENQTGYQNLLKIASAAQLEGFYYFPRIDHDFLARHSEGLICTSGCMAAEVPRMINNGRIEEARRTLDWYYEVFGADNFYLELQAHEIPDLDEINKHLVTLGRRYESRFVATNDVHYVDKDDARLQDIMLALQTGCLLSDPNRMRMTDNTYYLRSPQEMAALFSGVPGAVENTLLIAERCNVDLSFKGYRLPDFEVPAGETTDSYLRKLCEAGIERRYRGRANDPVVRERLDYELDIIHTMGFDAYFLIVWDLCRYAKQQGIWYNARGSAAGSIVAYALEITLVDPIEHGLIFERFLNPARVSMPDIDLDFRDDRRAEMMEYTARKYGDDKVAQIITFGTLGARAALRDVGRVLDIPLNEVDRVAKLVPNIPGKPVTIQNALAEVPEFKQAYQSAPYLKELIDTAAEMEGVVRSAGTHAAGVIITDKPVIDYIPLHRPTGSSAQDSPVKTVTQFEMSILDSLGLLKVDFLGLATLTIMARACDFIRERHGVDFNLDNIPTDDPATYELLGRGETAGVFQVEGSGMRRWLMEMKPQELANVIAMVALFRPGPMDSIPGYIRRMHGEEEVTYLHPSLEPIFGETYGYPVYQEQLMFAAMELADYTPAEADKLRKAVAKKKKDQLLLHREKFVAGAVKKGIAEQTAQDIFSNWEEFARYGFNKAHAADYGVIAVQTAYLKTHYPVEYMTAVLTVNQNDSDKVALYVADCRRMGIPVEPPDVNASGWAFTIQDQPDGSAAIRFGLGAVKNVGHGPVDAIIEGRAEQPFLDLNDFAHRVDLRQVGKRALESLIKVGALDCFGTRLALLEGLERIAAVSASHFRAKEQGQLSLFGGFSGIQEELILPSISNPVNRREVLNWERELIGLYVSDHPLSPVLNELNRAVTHFAGQLSEASHDEKIRVAGLITRIRPHQTRSGKAMGFVTLEDVQGTIDLVVFPRTWKQYAEFIAPDKIVLVDGRVDAQGGEPKVLVDSFSTDFTMTTTTEPAIPADDMFFAWDNDPEEDEEGDHPEENVRSTWLEVESDPAEAVESAGKGALSGPGWVASSENDHSPSSGKASQSPPAQTINQEPRPVGNAGPPVPEPFPDGWDAYYAGGDSMGEITRQVSDSSRDSLSEKGKPIFPAGASPVHETLPEDTHLPGEASPEPVSQTIQPVIQPLPDKVPASPVSAETDPSSEGVSSEEEAAIQASTLKLGDSLKFVGRLDALPGYLVARPQPIDSDVVQMVTIIVRSTGDKTRDVLRLRRLHGTIMSYPGNDRFAFRVYERQQGYLVEFPNFTTGVCQELISRLKLLVGSENVLVDKITFQ